MIVKTIIDDLNKNYNLFTKNGIEIIGYVR
jgi:hypothetical protein